MLAVAGFVWVSQWERGLERDHLNADAETRVAGLKYEIDTELQRLSQKGVELASKSAAERTAVAASRKYAWVAPATPGTLAAGLPDWLAEGQARIAETLERARDNGTAVVSAPFGKVVDGVARIHVAAAVAVYAPGSRTQVEQRRRLHLGYVVTALDPAEVLERSAHYPHADRMVVSLTDRRASGGRALLAQHARAAAGSSGAPEYRVRIPVGDTEWEVLCRSAAGHGGVIQGWQAWGALIFGLTFTLSITALVHLLSTRTHKVEALVEQRTRELENNNQELVAAHARALESSRLKSQFLANMSHEIRTPMNGIIGFTQLALATGLTGEQRDYLETVESSAELMMQIINDILDFSKIEAGRLEMEHAPFSLRTCVKLAMDSMAVAATQKGLALSWDVDEATPDTVVGDGYRLRQVMLNLLGNAIKFTSAGEVRVVVSGAPASESSLLAHFSVRDTGIGIPEPVRELIFEPFRQADGSTTRKYGGTGLGLAISARLVEMMNGHIWVESQEGRGSTFHFNAQLDLSPSALLPEKSARAQKFREQCPLTVLLAEDNVVSRGLVTALLRQVGHQVETACNGREAVEMYTRRPYDLVLMDVQMPEMDGLEATAEIRALERGSGRRTPVVALTAHAMNGDRERCMAAGMDEYLSKPVRTNELLAFISGIAAKRGAVQKS